MLFFMHGVAVLYFFCLDAVYFTLSAALDEVYPNSISNENENRLSHSFCQAIHFWKFMGFDLVGADYFK